MDPLTAPYLAEPVGNRVFFAGEATSTDRFGYVDGAFDTGRREAERIQSLCGKEKGQLPAYKEPGIGMRPASDSALRKAWYAVVQKYVL